MKKIAIHIISTIVVMSVYNQLQAQDTNYVKKYNNRMTAKGFMFNNNLIMADKETGLNYIPHSHSGIGIGIWSIYFPFDITYRQEFSFTSNGEHKYKKTSATDMQLKGYTRFFAGDIYIQYYKGFLQSDDNLDRNKERWNVGTFSPDLSSYYFAAVGDFIFNHKRFSYRAGFNAQQQQKISAGSALAGIATYYQHIKSDSTLFLGEKANLTTWSLGFNGGYAYNFVIHKKFVLFLAASVGLNASNFHFHTIFSLKTKLTPAIHSKLSFWYNIKNCSIGITSSLTNIKQKFERNLSITQNSNKSELVFVRRFWQKKQKTSNQ